MQNDKIKEYLVLRTEGLFDLNKKVMRYLENGYELQGGVSVTSDSGVSWYFQAVIKRR
jgi:hypothetical protein